MPKAKIDIHQILQDETKIIIEKAFEFLIESYHDKNKKITLYLKKDLEKLAANYDLLEKKLTSYTNQKTSRNKTSNHHYFR